VPDLVAVGAAPHSAASDRPDLTVDAAPHTAASDRPDLTVDAAPPAAASDATTAVAPNGVQAVL